jgi:hypothetical protein
MELTKEQKKQIWGFWLPFLLIIPLGVYWYFQNSNPLILGQRIGMSLAILFAISIGFSIGQRKKNNK